MTRGLGFSGLIQKDCPFQILKGPHLVASYDTQGDAEDLFLPRSSWVPSDLKFGMYKVYTLLYAWQPVDFVFRNIFLSVGPCG
jgi:hypothetical protein